MLNMSCSVGNDYCIAHANALCRTEPWNTFQKVNEIDVGNWRSELPSSSILWKILLPASWIWTSSRATVVSPKQGTVVIQSCFNQSWFSPRIISPRALDPRTLGPRTLDPRHPKSQGPVILGPMVLRTISPGILGPWKPWPLGPKVLWLKVLGPMVQGT